MLPFQGPGMNSRNHIMFGSVGSWFYRSLAGIHPNALTNIEIAPPSLSPNSEITFTSASYDSLKGLISSSWSRSSSNYKLKVQIPTNTNALIRLPIVKNAPYSALYESETLIWNMKQQVLSSLPKGLQSVSVNAEGAF